MTLGRTIGVFPLGVLLLDLSLLAWAPPTLAAAHMPAPPSDADVQRAAPSSVERLTPADFESWLDGVMSDRLQRGDIAGLVVTAVKDGQLLLSKGYGCADVEKRTPVDPARTLFRPGSLSKLFTWTAVMQLAEQGRLDLDRDINTYLDFKIPPRSGAPITLRDLMTHTPGFEESIRGLILSDARAAPPLRAALTRWIPERIYPAGTTPAYSNYGAGLAGYIVERVSRQPFDDYVEQHIFKPLGMTHSTFRQPLPAGLRRDMSKGYRLAAQPPRPYEIVSLAPAGSLATTGEDMARFMIAHLQDGRFGDARILRPETAQLMHRVAASPPLGRMTLGFGAATINGHRVIAHSGATLLFFSNVQLFVDDGIGLYVSVNSAGKDNAIGELFAALFKGFADRYLPGAEPQGQVDAQTARAHARMLSGTYQTSRHSASSFAAAPDLFGQLKVATGADGAIRIPAFTGDNGEPLRWREVAPLVWRDPNGEQRLEARIDDGGIERFASGPAAVFLRVPWWKSSTWLVPALYAALAVLLLSAVSWPVAAIVRRRYGARLGFAGHELRAHRLVRVAALAALAVLLAWAATIVGISDGTVDPMSSQFDGWLWLLYAAGLVAFVGAALVALWNAWLAWQGRRGRLARLWSLILVAACFVVLWFAAAFKLLAFTTNY